MFGIGKLALLAGILIALFISYNLIGQIFDALKAGDRLEEAVGRLRALEVKNQDLKKQLQDVKSPEFIEKQARDKLGLSKEGETIFVIPQEKIDAILGASKIIEEIKLPNWQGWLKLFF